MGQGQDVEPVELLDGNKVPTIGVRNFWSKYNLSG